MPNEPRVSVGISFFDEERYLGDAIRSILRQSFSDIELILVDDGSRDGSLAIARSFDDARIRIHADGERRRLPARLNQIARLARAPLVARMDGDDVSHPERLARELSLLERDGLDAVGTWTALVDETDEPIAVTEARTDRWQDAAHVLRYGALAHATMLARRDWLLDNPYDERLDRAEDRDLWCRTFAKSRFGSVPQVLYAIRVLTTGDFLASYAESQRQNRLLFARYGPQALGRLGTAKAILAARAKVAATALAIRAGLAHRLLARRGRAPTSMEREMVVAALEACQRL